MVFNSFIRKKSSFPSFYLKDIHLKKHLIRKFDLFIGISGIMKNRFKERPMKKIRDFIHHRLILSCFLIPLFIQLLILLCGLAAGGFTYASNDCYYQYVPFFTSLLNTLKSGSSLFYTDVSGLGFDYYTFACYYLFSPLNLLILFFKENQIVAFINILILLKVSLAGAAMGFYLKKAFNAEDTLVVLGSLMYALSGYVLGYQFNIMWLDGVALFPLIVLAMDGLIIQNRKLVYTFMLALAIISNYMMGYMICIMLLIRFFCYEFDSIKDFFIKGIRFALCSIHAALMSCIVLIPSYFSLSEMGVVKDKLPAFSWMGSFFDELSSLLFLKVPNAITFDSERVNLYCTVFAVFAVFLYFLSKEIKWKDKLKNLLVILFFFLSFNNELLNYIWHGFHKQSGIPNRFSFMLIFILITMTVAVFQKGIPSRKNILISGLFTLGSLMYVSQQAEVILISQIATAMLVLFYAFWLFKAQRIPIWIITLELFVMACLTFANSGGKSAYGTYELEEDYAALKTLNYTRVKVQDLDESEEKALTSRINSLEFKDITDVNKLLTLRKDLKEYGMRNSINESFIYDVPAISMFNTFCNQNLSSFYVKTGNTGSSNTLKMFGDNTVIDMLLGIQATVVKKSDTDPLIYKTVLQTEHLRIDENQMALPLGYIIKDTLPLGSISNSNPFENINTITKKIADETVYTSLTTVFKETDCTLSSNTGHSFTYDSDDNSVVSYTLDAVPSASFYFYVNCSDCSKVEFVQNDTVIKTLTLDKRIHQITVPQPDLNITVNFYIKANQTGTCRFYAAELNEQSFFSLYDTLSAQTLKIQEYRDGKLSGTIECDTDSKLLITIPVLSGWTVKIDGVDADYEKFCDSFFVLNLTEGSHTIELSYQTKGFLLSAAISAAAWLLWILLLLFKNKAQILKKADK